MGGRAVHVGNWSKPKWIIIFYQRNDISDMIRGNESDVANIDFEL